MMCRVLEVSSSGYYKWCSIDDGAKAADDARLCDLIRVLHATSHESYGVRRIVRGLRQQGIFVNKKRIRRLMRELGIKGKGSPRKFITTTDSKHTNPVAPNILNRGFTVETPNTHWVSDITYIWTEEGWLYLAVVIDLFSRMVVGWAASAKINAALVCLALEKAISKRQPPAGLVLHSDRGVQYTCDEFRQFAAAHDMIQSMSRKGNCWDNSVAESFFRTLKVEFVYGKIFVHRVDAENKIFEYIENFYNSTRAHSFLLYHSPLQWELAVAQNPTILLLRKQKFLK